MRLKLKKWTILVLKREIEKIKKPLFISSHPTIYFQDRDSTFTHTSLKINQNLNSYRNTISPFDQYRRLSFHPFNQAAPSPHNHHEKGLIT